MTVAAYKNLAESKYKTPHYFDYTSLEKKFWQNIAFQSPIYGADMPGTLTDKDVDVCVGLAQTVIKKKILINYFS